MYALADLELVHAVAQLLLLQLCPQHVVEVVKPVGELLDVRVLEDHMTIT